MPSGRMLEAVHFIHKAGYSHIIIQQVLLQSLSLIIDKLVLILTIFIMLSVSLKSEIAKQTFDAFIPSYC